jgi:hypothetical protein
MDASVCKTLAAGYDAQLGIRSLKKVVRDKVATKLDDEYMRTNDLISESASKEDYMVFIANGKVKVMRMRASETSETSGPHVE